VGKKADVGGQDDEEEEGAWRRLDRCLVGDMEGVRWERDTGEGVANSHDEP
jgi:hypothetical protein